MLPINYDIRSLLSYILFSEEKGRGEAMEEGEECQYLTSFYRIIMPSVVRQHSLVLPKKFVDEYGDELSNTVRLELPGVVGGGDNNTCWHQWHIGLRMSGGLLFFQDGFEKFMEHFSVGFGKFLLFKYKGNSVFNLHIFDLTAMEIDYGHGFDSRSSGQFDAGGSIKEFNDEPVSDAVVVRSTQRKVADFAESTPIMKQKGILAGKKSRRFSTNCWEEAAGGNQGQERARALNEAKMYKTDNPFFIVQIKTYSITYYNLHLPTWFCEDNKDDLVVGDIDLQDSDDRSWRVQCREDRSRLSLGKGFSQFVMDNRLKIGDVCVFEILCKGALKVSVFYA